MEIVITPVTTAQDEAALWQVREQVFERERGIALERLRLSDQADALHLLAWVEPGLHPIATLSVVETSSDHQLHQQYGLRFNPDARVARYTQLAVLRPYRGLHIPLKMMLEAHRRWIGPDQFDYTWLLFDADRAASSAICRLLAFTASVRVFSSEYGRSRALVRVERTPQAEQAIRQAELYLEHSAAPLSLAESMPIRQAVSV